MKLLYIIRHAKSGWNGFSQPDFERTLNKTGEKEALQMAEQLAEKKAALQLIVSSPAKRTFQTADFFLKKFNLKKEFLLKEPALYEATVANFYNAITQIDNKFSSVAIVAHNPGITAFVNSLDVSEIDDMPTCGIFAVKIKDKDWRSFETAEKEFCFFLSPKI